MPTDAVWYFGYGSNMSRSIFCERRGMRPLATRWGWLEGYRLCFDLPIGPGVRAVANLQSSPPQNRGGTPTPHAAHRAARRSAPASHVALRASATDTVAARLRDL